MSTTPNSANANALLFNNKHIINNMDKLQLNNHSTKFNNVFQMASSPSPSLQSFQNASLLKSMAYLNPVLMMNLLASSSSPSKQLFSPFANFSSSLLSKYISPSHNNSESFMKTLSNDLFHNKNKTNSNSNTNFNDIDKNDADLYTSENSNESEYSEKECKNSNYHKNDDCNSNEDKSNGFLNNEAFLRLMINYSKNMNLNNNKLKNEDLNNIYCKHDLKNTSSCSNDGSFKMNKKKLFSNEKKINCAVISTLVD